MTPGTARVAVGDHLQFRNGSKSPARTTVGRASVFGSNGEIGRADEVNARGPFVVIGRVGSYCGSLRYSADDGWITENALVATTASPETTRFWYYALQTAALNGRSSGSGQPLLNQSLLRGIDLVLPNISTWPSVAEVLGALDDKIAANATLIAQADELSALTFTSLLTDGETVPLSSLARFVNGKAFTKGASGTGKVVIRIAELNSGLSGSTVYNDIEVADDHLARPGDLLFAWSGSLTVHRWFRNEGIVNQHIFKVLPTAVPMWVVKGALDRKLAEFRAVAADKATTMGHIQRRHLDEPVAIPSLERIEAHSASMSALWGRALAAEQESLRLAEMRDALLPLLMSGKITVKGAERVVEGAV